jgi:hypothetical protein
MNNCRECKTPLSGKQQYCDNNVCGRMHAQRAHKARKGLISQRHCSTKAQTLQACAGCGLDCTQCHNTHPARPCALTRRVRVRGQLRQRCVVPADCKACPHASAAGSN